MPRTTKSDVLAAQHMINKALSNCEHPHRILVEWAYGRPRAYLRDENGRMESELSPRLSTGPMRDWLWAFYKGLCMGLAVDKQERSKKHDENV